MSASLNADDHGEWTDALCRQYPAELWFPEQRETAAAYAIARSVCEMCPLKQPCQEWAMSTHEREGMWGGLTPVDRVKLWRATGHRISTGRKDPRPRTHLCQEPDCKYAAPTRGALTAHRSRVHHVRGAA